MTQDYKNVAHKIMAILGIFGSIFWLFVNYHFLLIADTAPGTLIGQPQRHEVRNKGSRRTEYHVQYSFQVSNQTYQGRDRLDEYPVGTIITIYYDPDNPSTNQAHHPQLMGWWAVLGICIGLWFIVDYRGKKTTQL